MLRRLFMLWLTAAALPISAGDLSLVSEWEPEARPQLLILGTAHFANPGLDVINHEVEDVLSARRQAEMEELVRQLESFRPTHIAVEYPAERQADLDARYREYRAGEHTLGRDESEQIGLRLAARLGHARVHAVDWNQYPSGELQHYDWFTWGNANGHADWIAAIRDPERSRGFVELKEQSISEWLRQLNDPRQLAASHRAYYDIAMIGDREQQPGANWVGHWYGRNLRIFANLARLADAPQQRILVVYGQGHAYLLRQFARESGAFRLLDVEQMLSADRPQS